MEVRAEGVESIIERLRSEFEDHLRKKLSSSPSGPLISEVVEGGKRLRPAFLLLVFECLGGKDREMALDVAYALELAHNASLVHDDIIDLDFTRRGRPSLWRRIGIGRAVVEGHRIINIAFSTTLEKGQEIARIFVEAWDRASLGVLEEIAATKPPSEIFYQRVIEHKTGSLFAAAAESAAVCAGVDKSLREAAKQYGLLVGTAYQIADDIVELKKRPLRLSVMLALTRLEDAFVKFALAAKTRSLGALLNIAKVRGKTITFFTSLLESKLVEIDLLVESMPLENDRKVLLKSFPRYCVREMLKEGGVDVSSLRVLWH
ncbi:MAG: polyprenyl synthetase family protein [Thaumarchaeota archaeon]|nr:polyprenyl synthetase family protein [Candidatus Calditenuaceae archaeon]MDW8187269.1 polyprenyl synthetase family protein [Nitrososphaerota archaeon]